MTIVPALRVTIVPTLRVGMQFWTLCVTSMQQHSAMPYPQRLQKKSFLIAMAWTTQSAT